MLTRVWIAALLLHCGCGVAFGVEAFYKTLTVDEAFVDRGATYNSASDGCDCGCDCSECGCGCAGGDGDEEDNYCVPWDYCDSCNQRIEYWALHPQYRRHTLLGLFGQTQKVVGGFVDYVIPEAPLPFPLLSGLAEGSGMTLPPELGTGVVFTEMNRTVAVSDVRLAFGNNTPQSVNRVDVPNSKFHASSQIARLDLWIVPFFNLYGIVGHTRSTGTAQVIVRDFPIMMSPDRMITLDVDIEGTTAGAGGTFGIGGKRWFATLDYNKTWTTFDKVDNTLTAEVWSPRVGVPVDLPFFKGAFYVGAMYQDTAQTVDLTLDVPLIGNDLHVQVDQYEPEPWNFLTGFYWGISERLQVMVEGGSGGRNYIITGITLRH
ncbi:hypothetical protein LOC68_03175 [Blastopirellula sp. JC732]|uniref:Uncharacterized protein n=1 Tax=Blastopirellula sediminis TaxID=2894196 RepID=A0A9X1SF34_9BACT|nr:hypothetical protein [Blastopirellula sediminis]MCC9607820.1 hypothetical protein [Blastopirellula sediminis]MCC9627387.1 hypothetical protein [Blastopirellula sediminis]